MTNNCMQFTNSPEDGPIEVVCMGAMDGVQISNVGQFVGELTPGHLQDLICDVALNDLDKVLHLMSVQLQLAELG